MYAGWTKVPWREDAPLPVMVSHQMPVFKKTAELFTALAGDRAGSDAVCLRIGSIWGPLGLPDNPEPVKAFETIAYGFLCASFSIVGLLIQAAVGSLGGLGWRLPNRHGLAA